nr:hypothetical protein Iba_chr01eCG5660 [Ipomoea batatas]GMC97999.1 hypothetical protein Iba_chr05dCG12400 [Ipomoea batatas]GMD49112.1 hypothetical protein Iba_chr11aCG0610 [Ipomoea batatas]GMD51354.1 hypothetical protein Iba_chr11bCG1500 [Ipomoea batatas]GMD65807.1 hypothetical protein Iba_chr12cCG8900 [Ipomoea batatas]
MLPSATANLTSTTADLVLQSRETMEDGWVPAVLLILCAASELIYVNLPPCCYICHWRCCL